MQKVLLLAVFLSFSIFGQNISVTGIEKIDTAEEMYHVKFFPTGEKLLFTSSNYIGLNTCELSDKSVVKLNDYMNAGYENIFDASGEQILFRKDEYINKRKYSSLLAYNLETKEELLLEQRIRNLSVPELLADGKIFYSIDSSPKVKEMSTGNETEAAISNEVIVYQENAKIIVYNRAKKMIQPFGDGHYLWTEISPDKDKILFTYAGKGTFICDLQGNILHEVGYANAPKWSADGKFVTFMKDYDDGHQVTKSDIFVYSLETKSEVNITNTPDIIELYPSWSADNSRIVCNEDRGDVYLINLEIK